MKTFPLLLALAAGLLHAAEGGEPIRFDKGFEAGSLGLIEQIAETEYRLHVEAQQDNRGRNRQASWFFFRMDNVRGRPLVLTLTDYVGEYNDKPGACPMGPTLRPVFSYDGERWSHFPELAWDELKKEATLRFQPEQDRIWIAHVPPYSHARLLKLLEEIAGGPLARVEVIGHTAGGRPLHRVVVSAKGAEIGRKTLWLQARQHAWEAGTSFVMEGALRFIVSDDPRARTLRERFTFVFTPMVDPDGSATGKVRFNAHGYDLNRHWDLVDAGDPRWQDKIPETWHVKRSVLAHLDTGRRIDLFLNMHNTETAEYLNAYTDGTTEPAAARKLFQRLVAETSFEPSRPFTITPAASDRNAPAMFAQRGVVYCLTEQRIGPGRKLGRLPTVEDRLEFGRQLIAAMAHAVQ